MCVSVIQQAFTKCLLCSGTGGRKTKSKNSPYSLGACIFIGETTCIHKGTYKIHADKVEVAGKALTSGGAEKDLFQKVAFKLSLEGNFGSSEGKDSRNGGREG